MTLPSSREVAVLHYWMRCAKAIDFLSRTGSTVEPQLTPGGSVRGWQCTHPTSGENPTVGNGPLDTIEKAIALEG